jgi:hypothetical protein
LSNFGVYLLLPISLLIGISLASQAGVNSQLRLALSNPIQAAFISFLFGTIILGIVAFIQGDAWLKPVCLPDWKPSLHEGSSGDIYAVCLEPLILQCLYF